MSLISAKITANDLTTNANQKAYGLNDFRSMVNYENPKNKGYVRFTKGADGQLSIEKFNNQIDVPLSWRSNTKPGHNKAIREALAKSLSSYTKYLDAAKAGEIRDLVLNPKVGDHVDTGKALSRVELKRIFEQFDKTFNSATGRRNLINDVIQKAMVASGYDGLDQEVFMKEYLQCERHGITKASLLDYMRDKKEDELTDEQKLAGGVAKLKPNEKMFKSDKDFLALVVQIDNLAAAAKMRATMVNSCKSIARELVKNPGAYGDPTKNNAHVGEIRAALTNLMHEEHVADVNLGVVVGGGNPGLETFIGTVLPAMIRQAVENALELADTKDPASVNSVLESTLNVDSIFNTFMDFLKGAQQAVDKVKEADGQKLAQNLMDKLDNARSTYCKVDVRDVAVQSVKTIQFRDFGVATKLVNDVQQQLTMPIIKEVALENYAIDFVANTFSKVAPEKEKVRVDDRGVPLNGAIVKKAAETVTNLKIAGQLVWGVLGEKSANVQYKNGSFIYAESANKFLYEMENKAVTLTNAVKGGIRLYQRLLSGPVANMLNAKIANAKAGGINADLNIGEKSYQAAFNQMQAARDAWKTFIDEKVDVITGKARSGFISHLNYLVKRGNISNDDRIQLLADYDSRMRDAINNTVEKFFHEKTPLAESDKIEEMAKDGLNILVNTLKEERGNVMNDMKERIAIMVATNKVPINHRKILFDVPARIKGCREALANAKVKINGDVDDGTVNKALSKLWYKVMAERFASYKVKYSDNFDYEDFIMRTESEFVVQAKKFIKGYNAALAKIDKEVRELAASCIENELFENKNFVYYKQELSKKEFETLCKSMTDDLVLVRKPMIDAMKLRFFEHPDAYTKADINEDNISSEMFTKFGADFQRTDKNRFGVYAQLALKRGISVENWIDLPNGPESKTDLKTDLAANFSRRLSEVNMIDGKDGAKVVDPENDNRKVVEAAKDIPMLERGNIIKTAIKEVLDAASKYALSYATGGRKAFFERVEREVRERVDARILEYSKFRREFIPLTKPILEKYSAFGEETLKGKLDSVLMDQSSRTSWTKAKSFAVAFDGMLDKALNDKITMKGEEFVEYAKKIEKIYDKCVAAFNNKVAAMEQHLRDAGATDDDLAYMRNTLMPAMRSQLDAEIQKDPEAYARVKGGNDFGILLSELKAETVVTGMKDALKDIQIAEREGLVATLYSIGLREFVADDETIAVTRQAIDTWMKGDNTAQVLTGARRGVMLLAAYGNTATGTAVTQAKADVETFKKAVRDVLVGVRTTVLEGQFKADQVEPAVALFKTWLSRYNLPKLTAASDEFGTGTIEELAVAHFKTRIAKMQEKLAVATMQDKVAAPDDDEALLSAKYVTSLVQFINNVGLSAVIAQKQSEMIQSRRDEIVNSPGNKDIYDLSDAGNLPLERMTVKQMNNYGLTNFLIYTLDQAKTALSEKITTMEGLGRWGEEIDEAFDKAYNDNAEFFKEYEDFARRRVSMMAVIDEESNDAHVDALLTNALKAHFGVDILAKGALSEKFMKDRGADFNLFVKGIKNLCYTMVGAKVMALKSMAVSAPKPGDNLQRLPVNGVDDGRGGKYNLLTDVFESAVRSVVTSESLSPDNWTKKMFADIKTDADKVAAANAKAERSRAKAVQNDGYEGRAGSFADEAVGMYGADYLDQSQLV